MRTSLCVVLALLASPAIAQISLPGGGQHFVDFSQHLAHPGACVVVGTLGKWKEGKREKMAEGQLGGGAQVASISGTQYFKVPVTAPVKARSTLHGKADGVVLQFDVQLARLPDGKEHRQVQGGTELAEDQLALFVFVPGKKKGHELRAVVAFDSKVEAGGEASFVDTMRDHYTVNRRMHELTTALDVLDRAKDDGAKKAARQALQELVDKKPELKNPKHDGLLTMHCGPLEQRALKRLAEAGATPTDAGK
jgi:hypothetical protein